MRAVPGQSTGHKAAVLHALPTSADNPAEAIQPQIQSTIRLGTLRQGMSVASHAMPQLLQFENQVTSHQHCQCKVNATCRLCASNLWRCCQWALRAAIKANAYCAMCSAASSLSLLQVAKSACCRPCLEVCALHGQRHCFYV